MEEQRCTNCTDGSEKPKETLSKSEFPSWICHFLLMPMAEYIRASADRAKEGTATDKELETLPGAVNSVACLLRTLYNLY